MADLLYRSNPWILPVLMLLVLGAAIELPYRLRTLLYPNKVNPNPSMPFRPVFSLCPPLS